MPIVAIWQPAQLGSWIRKWPASRPLVFRGYDIVSDDIDLANQQQVLDVFKQACISHKFPSQSLYQP